MKGAAATLPFELHNAQNWFYVGTVLHGPATLGWTRRFEFQSFWFEESVHEAIVARVLRGATGPLTLTTSYRAVTQLGARSLSLPRGSFPVGTLVVPIALPCRKGLSGPTSRIISLFEFRSRLDSYWD